MTELDLPEFLLAEDCVAFVLTHFYELAPAVFARLEHTALRMDPWGESKHLLYALRVSHAVLKVTKLPTLLSRYKACQEGPVAAKRSGLAAGGHGELAERVRTFVNELFLWRLGVILEAQVPPLLERIGKTKGDAPRVKLADKLSAFFDEAMTLDVPNAWSPVEKWRDFARQHHPDLGF